MVKFFIKMAKMAVFRKRNGQKYEMFYLSSFTMYSQRGLKMFTRQYIFCQKYLVLPKKQKLWP